MTSPSDPADLADLDGPDRIARFLAEDRPVGRTLRSFGLHLTSREEGGLTVVMPLSDQLRDGRGHTSSGVLGLIADMCTGGAAAWRQDGGRMVATSTMTVHQLVAELPLTGELTATASLTGERGDHVLAEGTIHCGGLALASIAGWFVVRPLAAPAESVRDAALTLPTPMPAEPVEPDPAASPIAAVIGLGPVERGEGTARVLLPADPGLFNLMGSLHGGTGALLADLVCHAALDVPARPLSTTLSYLRTAGTRGKPVVAEARVVRRGRRVAMVEANVLSHDGRPAVHAVMTADVTG